MTKARNRFCLPPGYRWAPLQASGGPFCREIAAVVREVGVDQPELVTLANLPDARAYLGCSVDAEGRLREWLEIWVQNLDGFLSTDPSFDHRASSELLDRRWHDYWQTAREETPETLAWELPEEQTYPLYIDPKGMVATRPLAPNTSPWRLCRQDEVLKAAGLPLYSESTSRYLYAEPLGGGHPKFIAADREAPLTAQVVDPGWLALNPQGGLMALRVHHLLDFADYADLLSGATVAAVAQRKTECEADALLALLTPGGQDGCRHGLLLSGDSVVEVFYLKLRLLAQAGRALFAHLREQQCPFLNLDPGSFGVETAGGDELPWPWTTTCRLVRPGRALPLTIPGTTEVRFVGVGDSGAPAFCPGGLTRRTEPSVAILVRHVTSDSEERIMIEGTIRTNMPVNVEGSDMVRFRLAQGFDAGDFFGSVIVERPSWLREVKFRTWPRLFGTAERALIRRLEGRRLERCWCELIPAVSSPYDLYSLSALGARALLAHDQNPLAEVLDALEGLAKQAADRLPPEGVASLREITGAVAEVLAGKAPYPALEARHLMGALPDPGVSDDALPPALWAEALAILVRLMPRIERISQCPDYGAAPSAGLHLPLEEPLAALDNLLARLRSLFFADWNMNRDVRAVLASLRQAV